MTSDEYIDHITRDLQELIAVLDDAANTSAKVKERANGIQKRINAFYEGINDISIIPCTDCKYFFSELGSIYGSCTRIKGGDVVKETDFCSRAKIKSEE